MRKILSGRKAAWIGAGMTLVALGSADVRAQRQDERVAAPLEEVVVTARKREERLLDVPVSVAAQTGQELELAQVDTIVDLGARFANLAMPDTGSRGQNILLRIRGFGNNSATRTLRAGIIVDEVPYLSPRGLNAGLFDMARVQVLRGPQSTLYGLTAEAGLVVIDSVKPDLESFDGRLALQYGSDGEYLANGRVSFPVVSDRLAVALAATAAGGDGWIENPVLGDEYNQTQNWAGRLQILSQINDRATIQLQYAREEVDDDVGLALAPIDRARFNATNGTSIGEFASAQDYAGYVRNEDESAALTLRWGFDPFELVAVSAFRDFETLPSFDIDQGPRPAMLGPFSVRSGQPEAATKAVSQELRFQSAESSRVDWTAGVFYYRTEDSSVATATIIAPIQIVRTLGPLGVTDFESYAGFGQAGYTWGNGLTLTAGARYENVELRDREDGIAREARYSDSIFLPKLTASFKAADSLQYYASVGRGWLAGGVFVGATAAADSFYKPEESTTYEVGLKGSWLDGRLRANFALYRTDVDDYQESVRTGLITAVTANAGEVRFQGLELELAVRLTNTLTLTADLGLSNAEYERFIEFDPITRGLIDRTGNRVPGVAERDYNLALTYRDPRGWYAIGEVLGSGSLLETKDTRAVLPVIDGYTIGNLKLGYETRRWNLGVFVNNVTDREYFTYGNDQLGDSVVFGSLGRSRHIGVSAQMRFGAGGR